MKKEKRGVAFMTFIRYSFLKKKMLRMYKEEEYIVIHYYDYNDVTLVIFYKLVAKFVFPTLIVYLF